MAAAVVIRREMIVWRQKTHAKSEMPFIMRKFGGGLGGYARYIAVCSSDWPYGVTIGRQDAPLPKSDKPLHYDAAAGMRVR